MINRLTMLPPSRFSNSRGSLASFNILSAHMFLQARGETVVIEIHSAIALFLTAVHRRFATAISRETFRS